MVSEWALTALVAAIRWLIGTMPDVAVPSWLDPSGPLTTLLGGTLAMSAWMPWTLLATVGAACTATWLIGFGIKLVRIVASFLTLGGGSAA